MLGGSTFARTKGVLALVVLAAVVLSGSPAHAQRFGDMLDKMSADKPFALRLEVTSSFYFRGLNQIEREKREPGFLFSGIGGVPVSKIIGGYDANDPGLIVFGGFEINHVDIANEVPPGFFNAGAQLNGATLFTPIFLGVGDAILNNKLEWSIVGGYLLFPNAKVPTVTGAVPLFPCISTGGAPVPGACPGGPGDVAGPPVGAVPVLGESDDNFSFFEIGGSLRYKFDFAEVSGIVLTSNDAFARTGRSFYKAVDVIVPLPIDFGNLKFALELHGGHQSVANNARLRVPDFFEWNAGVRVAFPTPDYGDFYVRVFYTDTNVPENQCQFNPATGTGSGICSPSLIVSGGLLF